MQTFSVAWANKNFIKHNSIKIMLNRRFCALPALIAMFFVLCLAQTFSQEKNWRFYEQAARTAYKSGNTTEFVNNLEKALALKPNHPRLMYNLAAGYAAKARFSEALGMLEKVAATGMVYPAAKSPSFAILRDSSAFKAQFEKLARRFEESAKPTNTSTEAFRLTEKGLITESVTYDPQEKAFYVSSVHKRKIVKIAANGTITELSQPSDNLWSVLGMKVDAKRRKLWVCTTAFPQMQGFDSTLKGRAAVSVYDLKTQKIAHRYYAPNDGQPHAFGDLVLHPKTGVAFVSDSESPTIFMVDEKSGTLKKWLKSDAATLSSLQGLDFAPDGKTLFAADYSNGIFRIDVAKKTLLNLPTPDSCVVSGTDGLYYFKGNLIGIQNGTNPQRVVRYRLNKAQRRIEGIEILEANHADFEEPTLGVVVGAELYYVANSQWEKVSEKGVPAPEADWKPHVILKRKL
jgi:sugar lactone lactonase YvrE